MEKDLCKGWNEGLGSMKFSKEVFDSTLENNQNLNIKEIVKRLCTFCLSKKFVPFFSSNLKFEWKKDVIIPFGIFIALYESKEKYLSIKIIFPLFEELKNLNIDFLRQIKEFGDIKEYYNSVEFQKLCSEFEELCKKNYSLLNYLENNISYIKGLSNLYIFISFFVFYDLLQYIFRFGSIFNSFFKEIQKEFFNYDELNFIIDYLKNIDSLNHTKSAKQNALFMLNLKKNEKVLSLRDKIDESFFENYKDNLNIDDKLIWKIYEKDDSKSDIKYKKTILEGKMTEKEKLNYDFFEEIDSVIIYENIKGINGKIFQSLFDNNKIILIIKINEEYLKKNKITSEEIDDKIKIIKKSYISKYNNLETYTQSENKIINLDVSYDLFIQELKNKNILKKNTKIAENKINIKQIPKESFSEVKLNKSESNEEGKTNKILEEKIKRLEKELTEEKNKNKKYENIIKALRKELENEINKYKDLQKQIEEEKK